MTQTSATDVVTTPGADGQSPSAAAAFSRLSHDIKNALNAVSVNLEVARSRTVRGTGEPAQVVPFLDNAAQQIDAAVQLYKQVADLFASLTHN